MVKTLLARAERLLGREPGPGAGKLSVSSARSGRRNRGGGSDDPLVVIGELDVHTVPDLRRELGSALAGLDGPMVLDLSRVSFIDLVGVRMIDEIGVHLMSVGRALLLPAVSPCVGVFVEVIDEHGTFRVDPEWRERPRPPAATGRA
jgi:anti-anti-sigma factor